MPLAYLFSAPGADVDAAEDLPQCPITLFIVASMRARGEMAREIDMPGEISHWLAHGATNPSRSIRTFECRGRTRAGVGLPVTRSNSSAVLSVGT